MKVYNLCSKNGNRVPNQFCIIDNCGNKFFQSYNSIIAKKSPNGAIVLDSYYWDYSRTTSKYRNAFLGMTTEEIKKAIKNGFITLENLN